MRASQTNARPRKPVAARPSREDPERAVPLHLQVFTRLREHFSEAQIVELTWRIALCGAFNRFTDILQCDIEPSVPARDAAE